MPITLPPISRRRFVLGSLAAGATLALRPSFSFAADAPADRDPGRVILFSDIHIAADPTKVARNVNMTDHLKQAVAEALALDKESRRPSMAIVNGDCAYNSGETADYAHVVELLKPLRETGLAVHLGLGNHDNRERFWASIPPEEGGGTEPDRPVEDKQTLVLETPQADWIVLDSLHHTLETPGTIGEAQLAWLTKLFDQTKRQGKPVIVMVHHQPQVPGAEQTSGPTTHPAKIGGLTDTQALLDILTPRRNVKALIFGHTHVWNHVHRDDGLHLVNLPACAYVFRPEQPSGWVDCALADAGAKFTLHTLDPNHPKHNDTLDLTWRS